MAKKTSISEMVNSTPSKPVTKGVNFDLGKYNKSLGGAELTPFKKDRRLRINAEVEDSLNVDGLIPLGHTIIFRGHSDTGKSTLLIEVAKACQRENILPVFLISEMKWDFDHLIEMGFQAEKVPVEYLDEESGEIVTHIDYQGDFIFRDIESLPSIEAFSKFIRTLIDDQKAGKLPRDLMFLWDSVGGLMSEQSLESKNKNNMWDAGAMSKEFMNNVCPAIGATRKASNKYFSTLVAVNHVSVAQPENIFAQPTMKNKGGDALWKQATVQVTCGNVTKAGTSQLKVTCKGKDVVWGKRTKIQIEKMHVGLGTPSKGTVIMTKHGMIADTPASIKAYDKSHRKEWVFELGATEEDKLEFVEVEDTENLLDL